MRKLLVAGNWKMNTSLEFAQELAGAIAGAEAARNDSVEVLVCPPFPFLGHVTQTVSNSPVKVGAQNCYYEACGAFTGEVAIPMLKDVGCESIIIGHSERRHVFGETDELINKKVSAVLESQLQVILCVGELLEEREANQTEAVLDRQMEGGLQGVSAEDMQHVVLAYEPVWAIGTGKTATPDQAQSAHAHLRNWLANQYNAGIADQTRILYGGSVKPSNAADLLNQSDVDGALVGGASLTAGNFVPIIAAAVELSSGGYKKQTDGC